MTNKNLPKMPNENTIGWFALKYYMDRPREVLGHSEVVDWVEDQILAIGRPKPRDPWRQIRSLHEDGWLRKEGKGLYVYDPDYVYNAKLEDFSTEQKQQILARDNYRCVICGRGENEGVELHVDHIKPKSLGGRAVIENGQTLCAQHNFQKKNLQQTETGKKMFIRLYELLEDEGDIGLREFVIDVLKVYEKHNVNGHIEWKR